MSKERPQSRNTNGTRQGSLDGVQKLKPERSRKKEEDPPKNEKG